MTSPHPLLEHFYQTLPGYFSGPDFYSWLAKEFRNGHGVEVGSFMGRSAAYLAVEMLNWGGLGRLDLVDTWDRGAPRAEVRQALTPVRRVIGELHEGQSWDCAQLYEDRTLDFVYIDADHHYEAVSRDIDHWLPKVKPGGVISGHDYAEFPEVGFGVIQAVTERFGRVEVWRGERFVGDGLRELSPVGLGRFYPSWCVRV